MCGNAGFVTASVRSGGGEVTGVCGTLDKMKQDRWLVLAKMIGAIFDPMWMILLIFGWFYDYGVRVIGVPVWVMGLIMVIEIILPGLGYLGFMKQRGFKDWDISKREKRMPVFLMMLLSQTMGLLTVMMFQIWHLAWLLAGFWTVTLILTLISLKWKISVHLAVNSLLVSLIFFYSSNRFGWLYLGVALIGWARIKSRDHSLAQVLAGAILSIFVIGLLTLGGK